MSDIEPVEKPSELDPMHLRWRMVAMCIGYNELAKQAKILGEKLYFRILRDQCEDELKALGGDVIFEREASILTLPDWMPHINFTAKDIELMRTALKAFDEDSK